MTTNLYRLIGDDVYAANYQTLAEYRAALLSAAGKLPPDPETSLLDMYYKDRPPSDLTTMRELTDHQVNPANKALTVGVDLNGGGYDFFTTVMLDITSKPHSVVGMYREQHKSTSDDRPLPGPAQIAECGGACDLEMDEALRGLVNDWVQEAYRESRGCTHPNQAAFTYVACKAFEQGRNHPLPSHHARLCSERDTAVALGLQLADRLDRAKEDLANHNAAIAALRANRSRQQAAVVRVLVALGICATISILWH